MNEELVLPNVYGIVQQEGAAMTHVLLQQRWKPGSDPTNSGKWELPGGKWRAWESAHSCLTREVYEESGVRISRVLGESTDMEHNAQHVNTAKAVSVIQMTHGPYPSVINVFEALGTGVPLAEGDGSRNARWVPIDELQRLLEEDAGAFSPLSYAALRAWFSSRKVEP